MLRSISSVTALVSPLLLTCLLGTPTLAITITVPGDQPTIQAAIDASADGDVIEIAAGTYFENVRLFGKAITLRGAGIDLTTIDGSAQTQGNVEASTVQCLDGEGADTILEDLTITGGIGSLRDQGGISPARLGGGLFVDDGAPTLRRVRCSANSGNRGGGAYFDTPFVPLTIIDCEFTDNTIASAGGMWVAGPSELLIEDCLFARNSAEVGSGMGALVTAGTVTVRRSTFEENTAPGGGVGMGLAVININGPPNPLAETVTIEESRFIGNVGEFGGGLAISATTMFLSGCEFLENEANIGGAMLLGGSISTIDSTIIARNTGAVNGSAIAHTINPGSLDLDHCTLTGNVGDQLFSFDTSPITITNSIVWGNGANAELALSLVTVTADSSLIEGGFPGVGNIDADPLFVDAAGGDYRLSPASPCIDAGDPAFPLDPDGTVTDQGALPFVGVLFRRGDANLDGGVDVADPLAILADFFFGGAPIACVSAADANDDGLFDLADPIYLLNYLFQEGPEPPAPLDCGVDPTPDTSCEAADTGC